MPLALRVVNQTVHNRPVNLAAHSVDAVAPCVKDRAAEALFERGAELSSTERQAHAFRE